MARQIASIGGNPLDALLSGTFAPGELDDATAAGNTCNVLEDAVGCIFSQNLLVADASQAEILAAVADVEPAAAAPGASGAEVDDDESADCAAAAAEAAKAADNKKADKKGAAGKKAENKAAAPAAAAADDEDEADAAAADAEEDDNEAAAANVNAAAGALDFGECGNPAIQFAAGLDGRQQESFQAVNLADFNQGSALNIAIITAFIQDRLGSNCNAPEATLQAAAQAETAALAASGQAAADAWNNALGVSA